MIVEARYIGPHALVTVPNSNGKRSRRGEDGKHPVIKVRVRDGFPIGGCWDISKGKKEYEASIEKLQAEADAVRKARADRAAATATEAAKRHDPEIVTQKTKPALKGSKP